MFFIKVVNKLLCFVQDFTSTSTTTQFPQETPASKMTILGHRSTTVSPLINPTCSAKHSTTNSQHSKNYSTPRKHYNPTTYALFLYIQLFLSNSSNLHMDLKHQEKSILPNQIKFKTKDHHLLRSLARSENALSRTSTKS
jgi:hypothetical protein